jgi:MFS superfamily sulfate permease-like transporter
MDHLDEASRGKRSFEVGIRTTKKKDARWNCDSPMTKHVIRTLRRSRSRSFNDYIDRKDGNIARRDEYEQNNIYLPMKLNNKLIPPKKSSDLSSKESQSSLTSKSSDSPQDGNPAWVSIMYGLINATIVLPVIMSFGNIIYSNEAFAPYSPVLIKLTLISGVVHQLCFSLLSSLPFVVGSVQDAGLIFLASMASDMLLYCRTAGYDDETMLATVTVGLGVATATLGIALIIIGRLRLAGYVQMLPTCVIAGYLAFIGWFCGKSGLALMAGASELTIPILLENIVYVLPGVMGGIFIYGSVRTLKHIAVLPCCILILLVIFYTGLAVWDSSIEQATENGWIRKAEPAPVWYKTWDYLKLDKVVWSALPQLLLTEISMIFVVALSSSLDVAAIELEMKEPLDYDRELTMIGFSNMLSGITGGYTGSYIFSQSIFSLRSGIRSRLAGFSLALCEVIVIVCPFPILSYIPNFFYGSLLGMICIDLCYEWLWDFRKTAKTAEYIIGLSTFGLIQFLGVEYGILAGVALYVVCRQLGFDVGEPKMSTTENDEDDNKRSVVEQEEQSPLVAVSPILSNNGGQYSSTLVRPQQGSNQTNGGAYYTPPMASSYG